MENFYRCFRRNGYGVWICIAPGEVDLPQGRVQVAPGLMLTRGNKFMGVDMVKLLEEAAEKSNEKKGR